MERRDKMLTGYCGVDHCLLESCAYFNEFIGCLKQINEVPQI